MSRTPVEWIGVGVGTLALAVTVLFGLAMVLVSLYVELFMDHTMWRGALVGLAILAIPVVLYGFGRAAGRGWAEIGRSRP